MPTAIQEFLFGFRDALLKQNSATQHKVQPAEFSCKKNKTTEALNLGLKLGQWNKDLTKIRKESVISL